MCYVSSYYKFWFDLINLYKRIFFERVKIISIHFINKISNNFILNALRNPYIYMYIMSAYKIFVINLKALFKKKDPYWILHYSLPFQLTLEPCTPRPGPPVVVPTGHQTNTYGAHDRHVSWQVIINPLQRVSPIANTVVARTRNSRSSYEFD